MGLPHELLDADAALHEIHARVRFSAFLNPVNVPAARDAFLAGAAAPPFTYAPATWADDALDALRRLRVPRQHPLGEVVADVAADTTLLVTALRDRTAEVFDALTLRHRWRSEPLSEDDLAGLPEAPSNEDARAVPHAHMRLTLERALRARGLDDWAVVVDPAMSARVLVDATHAEVRVAPHARFCHRDLRGLVAHEIDVHVTRAHNGAKQPLRLFATGLHGAGFVEEGLALMAEARVGTLTRRTLRLQGHVARAVQLARELGFRDLYEALALDLPASSAWSIALRVKRGLADPAAPGAYAKDVIYLEGYRRVRAHLRGDDDLERLRALYVGKVGLDDAVTDWATQGWVTPSSLPPLWQGPA